MSRAILVLALSLSVFAGACSEAAEVVDRGTEAIGEGAERLAEGIDLAQFCIDAAQAADAVESRDFDQALNQAQSALENAPDDIRPDVQTVVDGARRFAEGDQSVAQDEGFQSALDRVRSYVEANCDPR